MYTMEDLEKARSDLRNWQDRFDRYSGNNPNKYQSDIKSAWRRIEAIESSLKASGIIPMSDRELLEKKLDAAFPKAQSNQIVEYNGQKFQRKFTPIEKSRSGKTVTKWGQYWNEVSSHD